MQGPSDGERWEIYTILADTLTFYDEDHDGPGCCGEAGQASDGQASGQQAASGTPSATSCC